MNTVVLSPKMPDGYGGRPLTIGKLVHGDGPGIWGYFIGYDTKNKQKVIVQQKDLENCLKGLDTTYKIRVTIEQGENFSFSHLIANLIPEKTKQEIINTL